MANHNKYGDLTGRVFGRLTAVAEAGRNRSGNIVWRCLCDCGKESTPSATDLVRGASTSCGCTRDDVRATFVGNGNPFWKGGRRPNKGGYMRIQAKGHPRADAAGYVFEHIIVMEEHLGRMLVEKENVHHLNGDRADNRIENLELWSTKQPPGQRIQDKVQYAIEILSLYGTAEDIAKIARKS